MAFWNVDLETSGGAKSAVHSGSTAAFVFAGMGVLGAVVIGLMTKRGTPDGYAVIAGGMFEALIGIIAGFRMRAGKGFYWAVGAAILLGLEIVGKLVAVSPTGIALSAIVMVYLVNGIRGLHALKHKVGYDDEEVDAFS